MERNLTYRLTGIPVEAAEQRDANISVKEMEFEYNDEQENTEDKISLTYTISIELIKEKKVIDDFTFNGWMRVEKRGKDWKVDWDKDKVPIELLEGSP